MRITFGSSIVLEISFEILNEVSQLDINNITSRRTTGVDAIKRRERGYKCRVLVIFGESYILSGYYPWSSTLPYISGVIRATWKFGRQEISDMGRKIDGSDSGNGGLWLGISWLQMTGK
jgi:hypothetical protein